MKVLFIQKWQYEQESIMIMSAFLKKYNHNVDVLVDYFENDITKKIEDIKPDLIAISCTSPEETWALILSEEIKKRFNTLIILGGIHPTIFPQVIENENIDIICRGEGEHTLLDLVEALKIKKNITQIKNLWVKQNDKIYKNGLRDPIKDLDVLPYPDRSIYDKYQQIKKSPFSGFIFSRGCHYACSFCYSNTLKKIYKNRYSVRTKSVNYAINELKSIKRYNKKSIHFSDSLFGFDPRWVSGFLKRYEKEVRIPFTCNTRPELVNELYIKKLKDAGCIGLIIGIETGNEYIRNKILKKRMADKGLIRAAKIIKKYKIKLLTENMFGLPHETKEDALKTIEINKTINSDYAVSNFLQLFPKLPITDYSIKNDLIYENKKTKFYGSSSPMLKNKDNSLIVKIQFLFHYLVKLPYLTPFIIPLLPYFPLKLLKHFRIYNQLNYLRFHKLSKLGLVKKMVLNSK